MFKHKHLLGIEQLDKNDIIQILDQAHQFKEIINRPVKKYLHCAILLLPIYFSKILPELNFLSS